MKCNFEAGLLGEQGEAMKCDCVIPRCYNTAVWRVVCGLSQAKYRPGRGRILRYACGHHLGAFCRILTNGTVNAIIEVERVVGGAR